MIVVTYVSTWLVSDFCDAKFVFAIKIRKVSRDDLLETLNRLDIFELNLGVNRTCGVGQ